MSAYSRIENCKNTLMKLSHKVGDISKMAKLLPWLEMTKENEDALKSQYGSDFKLTACLYFGKDNKYSVIYHSPYIDSISDPQLLHLILHETAHLFLGHPWRVQDQINTVEDLYRRNVALDRYINSWIQKILTIDLDFTYPFSGYFLKSNQSLETHTVEDIYFEELIDNENYTPDSTDMIICINESKSIDLKSNLKIMESSASLMKSLSNSMLPETSSSNNSFLSSVSLTRINPLLIKLYPYDEFLSDSQDYDYSYSRINRYHDTLPGRVKVNHNNSVCLILDTSGSTNKDYYNLYLQVALGFTRRGINTKIIVSDCKVVSSYSSLADFLKAEFRGGGGTNFTEALSLADSLPDVSRVLLLSDGVYSPIDTTINIPLDILVINKGPKNNLSKVPCNYYHIQ
jgi:predicted metal-dependent peptidase